MFITFEGGEGAGKSTLSKKVCAELKKNHEVLLTREPGGTAFGEEVRGLLLHHRHGMQVGARAELFLFLAARAQHVEEVILPALKNGKLVLCDRFSASTIAYQGAGRGLGLEYVKACDALAVSALIEANALPDLTFFVDVEPEVGLLRVGSRSDKKDHIEEEALSFHKKVRDAFVLLAKDPQNKVIVLDGHLAVEDLFLQAMKYIQSTWPKL